MKRLTGHPGVEWKKIKNMWFTEGQLRVLVTDSQSSGLLSLLLIMDAEKIFFFFKLMFLYFFGVHFLLISKRVGNFSQN